MKTISADRTYMDFTSGVSGVRVWEGTFQELYRTTDDSNWETIGGIYTIPASEERISGRFGAKPEGTIPPTATQIAFAIASYEQNEKDPELGKLLRGWRSYKEAVSTQ